MAQLLTYCCRRSTMWTGKYCSYPSHKHIFSAFRAQGTCLVAANVVLFLLNEI